MKGVFFPLYPGEIDVEFRFTIPAALEMERAAGCSYSELFNRTQRIEAVCLMLWGALRHSDSKLTRDKAAAIVGTYVSNGGNIVTLYEALQKAMNRSGCYAPAEPDVEDEARPTTETKAGEAVSLA